MKETVMRDKVPRTAVNLLITVALLIASVVVITWLLQTQDFSSPVRISLALVPPVIWIFCITFLRRLIRSLDELQQRIHLEALAIAFGTVFVAIFAFEYLRKAGLTSYLKPDHVMMIMMASLGIGYLVSWRRYQ